MSRADGLVVIVELPGGPVLLDSERARAYRDYCEATGEDDDEAISSALALWVDLHACGWQVFEGQR